MLAELGAADDIEKARTLLERACTLATTHGYGGIEWRSTLALRDLG
jgi:hypothetical protein